MTKISINSKVENGQIKKNRKAISDALKQFESKDIVLTIERKRKRRSNSQNAYYWGVIIPLIQQAIKNEWGERHTKEEIHEFLKGKFNNKEYVNEETGEIIQIGKSTTENTTVEMEEYHEDCRNFAKEWFNVEIPLPNEQTEIKLC